VSCPTNETESQSLAGVRLAPVARLEIDNRFGQAIAAHGYGMTSGGQWRPISPPRSKVPQETIDRILNHARPGLARTYNLNEYLDEKRKALTAWADRLAFIVGEQREASNVTEFKPSQAAS
jgi:hypothetical protein